MGGRARAPQLSRGVAARFSASRLPQSHPPPSRPWSTSSCALPTSIWTAAPSAITAAFNAQPFCRPCIATSAHLPLSSPRHGPPPSRDPIGSPPSRAAPRAGPPLSPFLRLDPPRAAPRAIASSSQSTRPVLSLPVVPSSASVPSHHCHPTHTISRARGPAAQFNWTCPCRCRGTDKSLSVRRTSNKSHGTCQRF
jgi:hypothetical protein